MTIMDMIRQVIERLRETKYSSAGGDSPRINFVKEFPEIQYQDFDEIIRNEVKRIIEEEREEEGDPIEKEVGTASGIESGAIGAVRQGAGFVQNPASIATTFMKFLPHTALIALALSLIPLIVEQLTGVGKMWDLRWKRKMQEEQNSFLDRQEQRNTQLGLRQVIVASEAGFSAMSGGAGQYNNLRDVREGGTDGNRIARIDMVDHSKELFPPLG